MILAGLEHATLDHDYILSTDRRGGGLAVHVTHLPTSLEFPTYSFVSSTLHFTGLSDDT